MFAASQNTDTYSYMHKNNEWNCFICCFFLHCFTWNGVASIWLTDFSLMWAYVEQLSASLSVELSHHTHAQFPKTVTENNWGHSVRT